jgi:hypothetical protein
MKLKLLSVEIVAIETLINETEIFPNSPAIVNEWVELIGPTNDSLPMKVCFDGDKYWLFDGYHRLEAMTSLGFNRCDVIIYRGNRRDALRRYIKDKFKGKYEYQQHKVFMHCIKVLTEDPEWANSETKELVRLFNRKPEFFENLRIYASIKEGAHHHFCFKRNKHGTLDFGKRYPSMWR